MRGRKKLRDAGEVQDQLTEIVLSNGPDRCLPETHAGTANLHCGCKYLVPRFGDEIAEEIRPFDIQRWLKSLHAEDGLAWTTISKMRGIMRRIYKVGIVHGQVSRNPVEHVETRSKTDYRAIVITSEQTLATINNLHHPLHFALVLTCAATALRASEILALRWSDILWEEERIRVCKRWAKRRRRKNENRCVGCLRPNASDACRTP